MSVVRFNTDRALFDAFPTAPDHIRTQPADLPPEAFLERLMRENKLSDALSFCAYLLRRRDAVAWGCESLAGKQKRDGSTVDAACLHAAEAWVRDPSETTRGAAYRNWQACDKNDPAAWLALGAAWSGGGLSPDVPVMVPAGSHLTASMVRAAFLLMLHETASDSKTAATLDWIAIGLRHTKAERA